MKKLPKALRFVEGPSPEKRPDFFTTSARNKINSMTANAQHVIQVSSPALQELWTIDEPPQNFFPIIDQNVKDDKKDTRPSSTDDSESSREDAPNNLCNFCKANYEEDQHNLEWLWKCGHKVCKKCNKVSELLVL